MRSISLSLSFSLLSNARFFLHDLLIRQTQRESLEILRSLSSTPLSPSPYTIRFFRWYIILARLLHNQFHPSLPLIITRVLFPTLIHFFAPSSLYFFCNSFRYSSWFDHNPAACVFNGESLFGSPNKLWMDNKIVLTLYAGDHSSFKISKQIFPNWSTFGWKHGVENFTTGALNGYSFANDSVSEYFKFSYAVPLAPSMVPTQLKMLSPSGNAEIPASEEVINDISSVCNLVVGEEKSEKSEQQLNLSLFSRVFQNQDRKGGHEETQKNTSSS